MVLKYVLVIDILTFSSKIALRWMSQDLTWKSASTYSLMPSDVQHKLVD